MKIQPNCFLCLLLLSVFGAFSAFGQESVPPGTIIPVRLNGTLSTKNAKPNKAISARVMQDVPLAYGKQIREGSKLIGHVVEVRPGTPASGPVLSFVFDRLRVSKMEIPVTTDLRAIASIAEVDEALIPNFGMGEGVSWNGRTTNQIGGDTVYWGGGPVVGPRRNVGKPLMGADSGVLVRVTSNPEAGCRGEFDDNHRVQALWVFSSDACGVYGLDGLSIAHAGRTQPVGVIELSANGREPKVPDGTGMLLRIIAPAK